MTTLEHYQSLRKLEKSRLNGLYEYLLSALQYVVDVKVQMKRFPLELYWVQDYCKTVSSAVEYLQRINYSLMELDRIEKKIQALSIDEMKEDIRDIESV